MKTVFKTLLTLLIILPMLTACTVSVKPYTPEPVAVIDKATPQTPTETSDSTEANCSLETVNRLAEIKVTDKQAYMKNDDLRGYIKSIRDNELRYSELSKELIKEYMKCK